MLWINGKRIVPAPFLTINQQSNLTADGRSLSSTYNLSLQGTLLPNMGSPFTTGWHTSETTDPDSQTDITSTEQKHEALLLKQEFLRELFSYSSSSGVYIKYHASGQPIIEAFCRPKQINFQPGTWVQSTPYTVDLDTLYLNKVSTSGVNDLFQLSASGYGLKAVSDSWQINRREDIQDRFLISRTVSAQADTVYGPTGIWGGEPWRNAQAWVLNRVSGVAMETNSFGLPTGVLGYGNYVHEESVNKLEGSYSITQRFAYGTSSVSETRNVQRVYGYRLLNDNAPQYETITVNGTIVGYPTGVAGWTSFNGSGGVVEAYAYWNSIKDSIGPTVGAFGTGTALQLVEDYSAGSLSYTLTFSNATGTTYKHSYDVSFTTDSSSLPVVTINGTVEGITVDGYPGGPTFARRLNSAASGWNTDVEPNLKSLAFGYSNGLIFPLGVTSSQFNNLPVSRSVAYNAANGTINYSAAFGYTEGSASNKYTNQYNLSFNTSNMDGVNGGLIVTAAIDGQIVGLSSGVASQKLAEAEAAFNTVENGIYAIVSGAANTYFSSTPGINNRPLTKSIVVNRVAGSISYNYLYSNALQASGTRVATAEISVDETHPSQVVAVQTIPGRAAGPITQNIGTVTEIRRNIGINLVMSPNTGGTRWAFGDRSTAASAASGYYNVLTQDLGVYNTDWYLVGNTSNWDWKNGVYTANYQILRASGG